MCLRVWRFIPWHRALSTCSHELIARLSQNQDIDEMHVRMVQGSWYPIDTQFVPFVWFWAVLHPDFGNNLKPIWHVNPIMSHLAVHLLPGHKGLWPKFFHVCCGAMRSEPRYKRLPEIMWYMECTWNVMSCHRIILGHEKTLCEQIRCVCVSSSYQKIPQLRLHGIGPNRVEISG